MGIDIESYRQRIGTFHPLGNKHKTRGQLNRKQFEFFVNQASRNRRNKTKVSDVLIGAGFYLIIFILFFWNSENEKIVHHQPR